MTELHEDHIATLNRHSNIALQLSGGKDSLACLYLLRPHWDRLTVYWCDAGSSYPETASTIAQIREMVPNFAVIAGRQPEVIKEFGIPTDILPSGNTPFGIAITGQGVLMQDRWSCCWRSMMEPMHQRMIEDGITLIIRGQKNADRAKSPVRSGDVLDGFEFLFPIQDWDRPTVMQFLEDNDAPIPRYYEMMDAAPDCMDCSAFWEEGAMPYLKRYHHLQYQANLTRLDTINSAVGAHIAAFNKEVSA